MNEAKLTIISARGRGVGAEIACIVEHLRNKVKNVEFEFFVFNERIKVEHGPLRKKSIKEVKNELCSKSENILCRDISIRKENFEKLHGKRMIVLGPYDYLFKIGLEKNKDAFEKMLDEFRVFSHVIVTSPFCENFFKDRIAFPETNIISNVCSSFSKDLKDTERIEKIQDNILFYFPELKGKKIMSIIITGEKSGAKASPFTVQQLEQAFRSMGNDWGIITNSQGILETSAKMNVKYSEQLFFVDKIFPINDLLFVSDIVLTNDCSRACTFAEIRKPVYVLDYNNNYFVKYIKKNYEELCICGDDIINKIDYKNVELLTEHYRFINEFAYESDISANQVIEEILHF